MSQNWGATAGLRKVKVIGDLHRSSSVCLVQNLAWLGWVPERAEVDEGEKEGMEIYFEGLTVKGSREMG